MSFYTDRLVPRLNHWVMRSRRIREVRTRLLTRVGGVVLEIGFGSGLNLPYYPPRVKRLLAIEPSDTARKLARKSIASTGFPVEFAGLDGQQLELPDESVDCVVSTWTMCTIPRPEAVLKEIARVLKPHGSFFFAEHGRAPDENVARWQDRLNGVQQRLGGGCNLNRPIDRIVRTSPLAVADIDCRYLGIPRTHTFFYVGTAMKT